MNTAIYLIQTNSKVPEMVKENYIVKFLMKIVLHFCNTKHLQSCQIYVNELMTASTSSSYSRLNLRTGNVINFSPTHWII